MGKLLQFLLHEMHTFFVRLMPINPKIEEQKFANGIVVMMCVCLYVFYANKRKGTPFEFPFRFPTAALWMLKCHVLFMLCNRLIPTQ
jgi:hypothetical protein